MLLQNYELQRDLQLLETQKRSKETLDYIKNNPNNNMFAPIDVEATNSDIISGFKKAMNELAVAYEEKIFLNM